MNIDTLIRKHIKSAKPYVPGKPIEEVRRELGVEQVMKLASNENPFGPSPRALRAMRAILPQVNRYPDASFFYLKKKLAAAWKVPVASITCGNGSDELIVLALRAFVNEGEEIITATPTFLIYEIASCIAGARVTTVPLNNFRYDLKAIKKKITRKTKMIFIANPDNPSGGYVTQKEVRVFLKGLPERVIVFFDEAYYEFGAEEKDYPRTLPMIKKHPVIVSRSFSKAYGLAGLRVGYAMAHPEIIAALDRVREPFNVNSCAQAAACAALDDTAFLARTLKGTAQGKKTLYAFCDKQGLRYVRSATNFLLIDCGMPALPIVQALLSQGIIVRDMSVWGLTDYIRVTIGRPNENRCFMNALKKALEQQRMTT